MKTPLNKKSTVEQIRERFDQDVDRFSTLETGQSATMDAPLAMELITQAAVASTPNIRHVLDIGCGAGNNTIKLRGSLDSDFDVTFVDLSQPMLERAEMRLEEFNNGNIRSVCGDFRTVKIRPASCDVILAAAVLHHLRDDDDWQHAFSKLFEWLRPGGSLWITDLVFHESGPIQELMWKRYGEYLVTLGGNEYRDNVFEYIDREDSPRPVTYQLELLRRVGFQHVELLHKNACFAAFGAVKIA